MEKATRHILKAEQKALNINLNKKIYGTFAEIGAGQEVARNFFQAGAAVGTIAKTMSAYDKTYSDSIYGPEESGRYVCESRLYKMLDHEYSLMEERLTEVRPDSSFFVFADTVAAINYKRTIKGHGWLGVRFQLTPDGPANDLIIHVNLMDQSNHLQQEAIGVLGVNMVYACYKFNGDLDEFIQSLVDGIWGRVEVDLVRLEGPDFKHIDNRLLTLKVIKYKLADVAMFSKDNKSIHASEFLWKKDLMVVRGHFRPPTKVTLDVFKAGLKQFIKEGANPEKATIMAELTISNLEIDGKLDEDDFIERAEALCALGFNVIISDCDNHQNLVNYLSDLNIGKLGLVIGVKELYEIIDKKFHNNQDGRLLVAFGELFNRNITVYVYPAYLRKNEKELVSARTLIVPDGIHFLYKHLIDARQIVEIEEYNKEQLDIMPWNILDAIKAHDNSWETLVPDEVVNVIKQKHLFTYES